MCFPDEKRLLCALYKRETTQPKLGSPDLEEAYPILAACDD